GILVDANQAWADLLGFPAPDGLLGSPLMDHFEAASQAALKGALVACAKGQWGTEALKATAVTATGSKLPLELHLEATAVDREPAIKLAVPRRLPSEVREPEELVEQAVHKDATTG